MKASRDLPLTLTTVNCVLIELINVYAPSTTTATPGDPLTPERVTEYSKDDPLKRLAFL